MMMKSNLSLIPSKSVLRFSSLSNKAGDGGVGPLVITERFGIESTRRIAVSSVVVPLRIDESPTSFASPKRSMSDGDLMSPSIRIESRGSKGRNWPNCKGATISSPLASGKSFRL